MMLLEGGSGVIAFLKLLYADLLEWRRRHGRH